MEKLTVKNLHSIAKRNNLGGDSKLPKSELIAYLRTNLPRRRNHGQNHKPWRHSRNKKFAWWWHSWTESTTATTNRIYSTTSNTTAKGDKIQRKTGKMGWLVVKICCRACEKTNQQRFERFQEKSYELVSKITIKVWRKQKIGFERVCKRT